jgi:hypothetical protein
MTELTLSLKRVAKSYNNVYRTLLDLNFIWKNSVTENAVILTNLVVEKRNTRYTNPL